LAVQKERLTLEELSTQHGGRKGYEEGFVRDGLGGSKNKTLRGSGGGGAESRAEGIQGSKTREGPDRDPLRGREGGSLHQGRQRTNFESCGPIAGTDTGKKGVRNKGASLLLARRSLRKESLEWGKR